MAKKNKDQDATPSVSSVANRDILQRLNFLYQASTYLNSVSSSVESSSSQSTTQPVLLETEARAGEKKGLTREEKQAKRRRERHPTSLAELSRTYVQTMKIIGQKATVKMDPNVKRTICKGCNTILIPGTSASVRVKSSKSHGNVVSYQCFTCKTSRRIPAPPLLDRDAATASSIDTSTLVPGPSNVSQEGTLSLINTSDVMNVDPTPPSTTKKKSKKAAPRPLPLFQRKGHVVFRGNEMLENDDMT